MNKFCKKTGAIALMAMLFLSQTALWGGQPAYAEAEGDSFDHPHLIGSAEELAAIGTGSFEMDDYYKLTKDIDLLGYKNSDGYETWNPIGGLHNPFTGGFDGNGHTISNLKVYDKEGPNIYFSNRVGLFGKVNGATIKNIGLTHVFVSGTNYVGGLVGFLQNSTINNAYVTGTIYGSQTDPPSDLGGLVGYAMGGTINDSYADVVFENGGGDMGELLGKAVEVKVNDSYYVDVNTIDSSYGIPLTADQMKQQSSFSGWDIGGVWHIFDGQTYPLLDSDYAKLSLADLSLADVTGGKSETIALPEGFSSDLADYETRVMASVQNVKLNAQANDAESTLTINDGVTVTTVTYNTDTLTPITLKDGKNIITLTISNPAETYNDSEPYTVTYTLTIEKEDGSIYPHSISTPAQLADIGSPPTLRISV